MLKMPFDRPLRKSRIIGTLRQIGRWTLVMVVLCLAFIGLLHLTRGTAVRHVRGVATDGIPISVNEPEFPLMATMTTGAWLAPGNRVEVMLNGDETYPRLWEDLRSAQQSITLQLYYARRVAWPMCSVKYFVNAHRLAYGYSFSATPSVPLTSPVLIAMNCALPGSS